MGGGGLSGSVCCPEESWGERQGLCLRASPSCPLGHPDLCLFSGIFLNKVGGGVKLMVVPAFLLIAHRTAWLQKGP